MAKQPHSAASSTASAPSVRSAIAKLQALLSGEEKRKWLGMIVFALIVSSMEILTATIVVLFGQVLNQPSLANQYLNQVGLSPTAPHIAVLYIAILVGLVYLIKNALAAAEVFFQNFSVQKMGYNFKNTLLRRYADIDYGIYLTHNASFGLQVINGDAEQAFSIGMLSLACILSESIIFFGLTGLIVVMHPRLALILCGLGIGLGYALVKWVLPKFYRWGQILQQAGIKTNQHLLQFFHGFKEIILLGKREAFIQNYATHSAQRARIQAMQTATNSLPRLGIEILFVGLFVFTIAYLCLGQQSPMQMMGLLSGYLYAGFRLMPGLNRIVNQLNTFKMIIPTIERVHAEYTAASRQAPLHNVPELTFQQAIDIKDLSFTYPNTQHPVLNGISLTIPKGACIGIIGETGSGKSTLIDCLLGLLSPTQGCVVVDGKFPVDAQQWHQKLGYVPQAIYLTDDTIAANIAFGEAHIDNTRLNEVIDLAQLRKFITALPNGTQTIVGERGIRLSGGERQRIAIARALYHQPEVLIFDEATSALDNETEAQLMQTINQLSKQRTVIMVAHRLSTLRACSRVYALKPGVGLCETNTVAEVG